MKKILFFVISLLIFIRIKSNELKQEDKSSNIAVIPFKTFYIPNRKITNSFSSKEYVDIIHSSSLYLEIEVGKNIKQTNLTKEDELKIKNNKQFMSLFITLDDYNFYIDDNYFFDKEKKLICRYSSQLSTSYEIGQSNNKLQNNEKNAIFAIDYFKIYSDISMNKYNMIKMEFKHSLDNTKNISFACGKTGLLVPSNKLYIYSGVNFINQIHNNIENIDYSFIIKYNKSNEEMNDGILIIGQESYEKYNKEELIPIYTKPNSYGSIIDWRFEVDQITIGSQFFEINNEEFIIKTDFEGIEIPYSFYKELNKIYFNNYYKNKICKYEIVNNIYIVIFCNSNNFTNKDIKNFPVIKFLKFKLEYNFTFYGEELFYKRDNNYFFKMIAYLESFKTEFKLGRIFLKKYSIIFDPDLKTMLFYNNNKEIKNDIINNRIKSYNLLIAISYIFMGLIFLITGIYFGRRFCILKRKRYANELEDNNYIYESKSKGIKKDQKLIEL